MRGERLAPPSEELCAANGSAIPVVGEAEISLKRGRLCLPVFVSVSPFIKEPLLGADWLQRNHCLWNFGENHIVIKGKRVPLQRRRGGNQMCRRIAVKEDTVVPAWSAGVIRTKVESSRPRRNFENVSCMNEREESQPGVCADRVLSLNRRVAVTEQITDVVKQSGLTQSASIFLFEQIFRLNGQMWVAEPRVFSQ